MFSQGSGNDIPGYERVDFSSTVAIKDFRSCGLFNILHASAAVLHNPGEFALLPYLEIPEKGKNLSTLSRIAFSKYMAPLLTIEATCDMAGEFMISDLLTRQVFNHHDYIVADDIAKFKMEFRTSLDAYKDYQRYYSNGIWMLHEPTLTSFDLLNDAVKVALHSIFVYIRHLTIVKPKRNFPKKHLPVWPSFDNAELPIDAEMVTVSLDGYINCSSYSPMTIDVLKSIQSSYLTFVSSVAMYIKLSRMVNIPEFPIGISKALDYNVSPLYDCIINPTLFNLTLYHEHDSFGQKFNKLMAHEGNGILILEGGPGTGKTSAVVKAISSYIEAKKSQNSVTRILVCAPSNSAADVIFCKLDDRFSDLALDVIISRVGLRHRFSIASRNKMETMENIFYDRLQRRQTFNENRFKKKLTPALAKEMLLDEAEIVITTLGYSQSNELLTIRNKPFDLLVVDECGQANFVELMLPLHFTKVHRMLLIGDPRQLGPVCKSGQLSTYPSHQVSIFVRLWKHFTRKLPLKLMFNFY